MATNNAVNNLDDFVGISAALSSDIDNATGSGTICPIPYDTVFFQKGCSYNTSTGEMTCLVEGYYQAIATINFQIQSFQTPYSNNTMELYVQNKQNGSLVSLFSVSFNTAGAYIDFYPYPLACVTGPFQVDEGNVVSVYARGTSGNSNNINIVYSLGNYLDIFPIVCTTLSIYRIADLGD